MVVSKNLGSVFQYGEVINGFGNHKPHGVLGPMYVDTDLVCVHVYISTVYLRIHIR